MCCDQLFLMHRWLLIYCLLGCLAFHREKLMASGVGFWVGGWFFPPLWWHDSWGTLSCTLHTLQINITLFTVFTCIAYIYYIITILLLVAKLLQFVFTQLQFFLVYDCDCVSMRICLDNNKLIYWWLAIQVTVRLVFTM